MAKGGIRSAAGACLGVLALASACGGAGGAEAQCVDGGGSCNPATRDAGRDVRESGKADAGDRGIRREGDAGCVPTLDTNPYCEPYPTANIGTASRGGSTPGQVIKNFRFWGYSNTRQGSPTVDTGAPVTISLADFYDPQNRKFKLLHLSAVGSWCGPAALETVALVGAAEALGAEGVVILQDLGEGPTPGDAATLGNLRSWMKPFMEGTVDGFSVGSRGPIDFNIVLDPQFAELGAFVGAAIPWEADIDVRTMEILYQNVGENPNTQASIEGFLKWVETNPPSKE
jgi:hypothetical protein